MLQAHPTAAPAARKPPRVSFGARLAADDDDATPPVDGDADVTRGGEAREDDGEGAGAGAGAGADTDGSLQLERARSRARGRISMASARALTPAPALPAWGGEVLLGPAKGPAAASAAQGDLTCPVDTQLMGAEEDGAGGAATLALPGAVDTSGGEPSAPQSSTPGSAPARSNTATPAVTPLSRLASFAMTVLRTVLGPGGRSAVGSGSAWGAFSSGSSGPGSTDSGAATPPLSPVASPPAPASAAVSHASDAAPAARARSRRSMSPSRGVSPAQLLLLAPAADVAPVEAVPVTPSATALGGDAGGSDDADALQLDPGMVGDGQGGEMGGDGGYGGIDEDGGVGGAAASGVAGSATASASGYDADGAGLQDIEGPPLMAEWLDGLQTQPVGGEPSLSQLLGEDAPAEGLAPAAGEGGRARTEAFPLAPPPEAPPRTPAIGSAARAVGGDLGGGDSGDSGGSGPVRVAATPEQLSRVMVTRNAITGLFRVRWALASGAIADVGGLATMDDVQATLDQLAAQDAQQLREAGGAAATPWRTGARAAPLWAAAEDAALARGVAVMGEGKWDSVLADPLLAREFHPSRTPACLQKRWLALRSGGSAPRALELLRDAQLSEARRAGGSRALGSAASVSGHKRRRPQATPQRATAATPRLRGTPDAGAPRTPRATAGGTSAQRTVTPIAHVLSDEEEEEEEEEEGEAAGGAGQPGELGGGWGGGLDDDAGAEGQLELGGASPASPRARHGSPPRAQARGGHSAAAPAAAVASSARPPPAPAPTATLSVRVHVSPPQTLLPPAGVEGSDEGQLQQVGAPRDMEGQIWGATGWPLTATVEDVMELVLREVLPLLPPLRPPSGAAHRGGQAAAGGEAAAPLYASDVLRPVVRLRRAAADGGRLPLSLLADFQGAGGGSGGNGDGDGDGDGHGGGEGASGAGAAQGLEPGVPLLVLLRAQHGSTGARTGKGQPRELELDVALEPAPGL